MEMEYEKKHVYLLNYILKLTLEVVLFPMPLQLIEVILYAT